MKNNFIQLFATWPFEMTGPTISKLNKLKWRLPFEHFPNKLQVMIFQLNTDVLMNCLLITNMNLTVLTYHNV